MLHIQSLGRYKEKDIYIDRLSFHKVERSNLTKVLNATLMNLSPIVGAKVDLQTQRANI